MTGQELDPGTRGARNWKYNDAQGCSGMLRDAQTWNRLAQPQLGAAYSPLRIWSGPDSGVSIVASDITSGSHFLSLGAKVI